MKYISSIFSTGAVRKTPDRIIRRILAEVDINRHQNFIELGAGNGEITAQIVKQKLKAQKPVNYDAFEIDTEFSKKLVNSLPEINVVNHDAFDFEKAIDTTVKTDIIISSIPLSFYPRPNISDLLKRLKGQLSKDGKLIILYHAFWLSPLFRKALPGAEIHSFTTIPPYFLLVFREGNSE